MKRNFPTTLFLNSTKENTYCFSQKGSGGDDYQKEEPSGELKKKQVREM